MTKAKKRPIFFQKLIIKNKGELLNLPFREIIWETLVLINIGSDIITAVLIGTVFLLAKYPEIPANLRQEMDLLWATQMFHFMIL